MPYLLNQFTYLIPAVGGRNIRHMKVGVPPAGGSGLPIRELPGYGIVAIRIGQFTGEGAIWKGSFDVVEPADDGGG